LQEFVIDNEMIVMSHAEIVRELHACVKVLIGF